MLLRSYFYKRGLKKYQNELLFNIKKGIKKIYTVNVCVYCDVYVSLFLCYSPSILKTKSTLWLFPFYFDTVYIAGIKSERFEISFISTRNQSAFGRLRT